MATSIPSVTAKLERAESHINELEARVAAWVNSHPYKIIEYSEIETKNRLYAVKVRENVPPALACIVGDALNNLRTSLDYLAWHLAKGRGDDALYFPISNGPTHLEAKLKGVKKLFSSDAIQLIRLCQPYKGGHGHGLWQLHELNRFEKHRLLLAVGGAHSHTVIDFASQLKAMGAVTHLYPGSRTRLPVRPKCPLKDGDVVLRVTPSAWSRGTGVDPEFAFYVSLDEPQVIEPQPIVPTLRGLLNLVNGTIKPFLSGC